MPYQYAYLIGCSILFILWLLIFVWRKDLRREMIWASLWGLPFGFIDFFLVPTYWHPDSLFDLIGRYGLGIESFIFFSLMIGLASVIYEFAGRKRLVKVSRRQRYHFGLLLFVVLAYVSISLLFPGRAIYHLMVVSALGAGVTGYFRRDLWTQIIVGGLIFSLLYWGVFILINFIFPGLVERFYNLNNTWGILLLGVPLEEIVGAFLAGAFWSTLYEYTRAYRVRKSAR